MTIGKEGVTIAPIGAQHKESLTLSMIMTLLVRSQGVNICLIAVIGNGDQRAD